MKKLKGINDIADRWSDEAEKDPDSVHKPITRDEFNRFKKDLYPNKWWQFWKK